MPPLSFSVFEGVAPIRSCTGPHEIGQGGNRFSVPARRRNTRTISAHRMEVVDDWKTASGTVSSALNARETDTLTWARQRLQADVVRVHLMA